MPNLVICQIISDIIFTSIVFSVTPVIYHLLQIALKTTNISPQNGTLSAVPYICQAVSGFIAGQTADILRSKGVLNTTHTRKLYQNLGIFLARDTFYICIILYACSARFYPNGMHIDHI